MRVRSYLNNDAQGRGKKEEEEIARRESTDCSVYLVVVKMKLQEKTQWIPQPWFSMCNNP